MRVLSPSLVRMERPLSDCVQPINNLGCQSVHIDVAQNLVLPQCFSLQTIQDNLVRFNARVTLHMFQSQHEPVFNFGFLRQTDLALLHVFPNTSSGQIASFLEKAKNTECNAGLAIDLPVDPSIIEPYLEKLHTVFIMGIPVATHGLLPNESTESRIAKVHNIIHANKSQCRLGLDGGVNATSFSRFIGLVDELVVGSLLFHSQDVLSQWQTLKKST